MKLYVILFLNVIFLLLSKCQIVDDSWNSFSKSTGLGGHHTRNPTDYLKDMKVCSKTDSAYGCNLIIAWYLVVKDQTTQLQNQADLQIKNSTAYSTITFTFRDQVVTLTPNEISKKIVLNFDPAGLYKIETSSGVVFENSSFNFRGSLKDGTIITTDGTLINDLDLAGCNLINVETGKIETVSGQCLTPTNP